MQTIAEKWIERGMQKGMKAGIEQGMKKGMQKGKIEAAKMMLMKGFDTNTIIEITGVSREDIEKLAAVSH